MSFHTSLRRRPSCTNLIPSIQAAPLKLLENDLSTHDLSVTIRLAFQNERQELLFLICTPSSVTPQNAPATIERVQRVIAQSGGRYCGVIFHLSPTPAKDTKDAFKALPSPANALNILQILLHTSHLNIPLLPLAKPSSLRNLLTTFATPFTLPPPSKGTSKATNAAMDILPWCTTNAPMTMANLVKLTDLTSCLRDVASLRDGDAGRLMEQGGMNGADVEAVLGFWREEWIAE